MFIKSCPRSPPFLSMLQITLSKSLTDGGTSETVVDYTATNWFRYAFMPKVLPFNLFGLKRFKIHSIK